MRGQRKVNTGSTWGKLGDSLGSTWRELGVNLASTQGQCRVNAWSTQGQRRGGNARSTGGEPAAPCHEEQPVLVRVRLRLLRLHLPLVRRQVGTDG